MVEHDFTLAGVLRRRAGTQFSRVAYRFLGEGETETASLTWGELDRRARAIAAALQQRGLAPGERVLLALPSGLDFIAAFFGCLYAGQIAVPAPLPAHRRARPRFDALVADAGAAVTLDEDALAHLPPAEEWREHEPSPEDVAFLQYTSGSTSAPRGVIVTHANLMHNSRMIRDAFAQNEQSCVVGWLPMHHDMGLIGNVLQPLYSGGTCVLMPPAAFLQRPLRWLQAISRYGATTSGGPDFAYALCARRIGEDEKSALDLSTWRVAFNGSEPVRHETLERFSAAFARCGFRAEAFHPCYGLAEATLLVTAKRAGTTPVARTIGERVRVSSGRAAAGQHVEIIDGEICVRGASVARGYWRRPAETEEVFGGGVLRTGDLGVLDPDGELFVTGRRKELVIIRGRNHYPHDIERTVEEASPALVAGGGAAFAVEAEGTERLVIVSEVDRHAMRGDLSGVIAAIRAAVADEHEIQPHAVVLIRPGTLPKTTSGKVQRRACARAFLDGTLPAVASSLADAELDADATVASLGLDSLQVLELRDRIERKTGVLLSFEEIFNARMRDLEAMGDPSERSGGIPATVGRSLDCARDDSREELSDGQRSLWFMHRLAPDSAAYHVSFALRATGPLDVERLRRAWDALVERHEMLRSRFPMRDGQPVRVTGEAPRLELVERVTLSDAERPFDIERGPLVRLQLDREGVLLFVAHHILVDFWSLAVLMDDLRVLYGGGALPPVEATYADFVRWQKTAAEAALARWEERLADVERASARPGDDTHVGRASARPGDDTHVGRASARPGDDVHGRAEARPTWAAPLELPTDFPRPPVQTYRGAMHHFTIDRETIQRLRARMREHEATLFTVLLTAWSVLLSRYSGQQDLLIGAPAAGRSRAAFADVAGYFANLVPLRCSVRGTFAEMLAAMKREVLEALTLQDAPFPRIVERVHPQRDPSRTPLFQAVLALEKPHRLSQEGIAALALGRGGARIDLGPLQFESVELPRRAAQFDVTLMAVEAGETLEAALEYNTDLFTAETMERMARHFVTLVRSIAATGELSMIDDDERRLLASWNDTARDYPRQATLGELFDEQAALRPDAVALEMGEERLTYGELAARADALAARLAGASRVGLLMERGIDLVVSMLAAVKAGAAYVPLDPAYPEERLQFMLDDAGVDVLLRSGGSVSRLEAGRSDDAERIAYIIYTSGSTGKPKGVLVPHRAIIRLVRNQDYARFAPDETFLHFAPATFDAATFEVWGALLSGARLVIQPPGRASLDDLGATIAGRGVTTLWLTAGLFHAIVDERITVFRGVRQLLAGGDVVSAAHVKRLLREVPGITFVNGYGPTEATTFTCCHRVTDPESIGSSVPIGKPLANTTVHVLDRDLQPVPVGVPGELFIGGDGVAVGYTTGERFEGRYRTGDRVRWNAHGELEFLGRFDHQLKIRGFRIEPGEIESVLREHEDVDDVVVIAREQTLVAYVIGRIEGLRDYLRTRLPEHMVPSRYVALSAFPLTANGKVDRRALPAPERPLQPAAPPRTEAERIIAAIFREALGVDTVGLHDNFFDLGAHSLLLAKVHARLQDALGRDLAIVDLFAHPTIASLAAHLSESDAGDDFQDIRARAAARRQSMQQRRPARTREQREDLVK